MSATKTGRGLAAPDSRRRPGARRPKSKYLPLFEGGARTAPGSPAGGTHRVPDPQPVQMPELDVHRDALPETWWEPFLLAQRARAGRLRSLWQMTPAQRVAAMRRGDLTYEQLAAWSSRHPEQVPTLHGEFEWIVARLAEACE